MGQFALLVLCAFAMARVSAAQPMRPDTAADPYRWLEDVSGARAMAWVKAENGKSAGRGNGARV